MRHKLIESVRVGLKQTGVYLIVITLSLSALATGQTRTGSRSGSISGRAVSQDGQGVEGAIVICNPFDKPTSERMTSTDVEGQFSFTGLAPVGYRVACFAPGYVLAPGTEGRVARIGESLNLSLVKGGAITGRVTDPNGAPVVAVQVTAYRMRDVDGRALRGVATGRSRQTDDRGIYRLYGLEGGSYFVAANPVSSGMLSPYDLEAPTYFPSSNRDSASEVAVQPGSETTGIDIRYRNTRGHTIGGTVEGVPDTGVSGFGMSIELVPAGGGSSIGWGMVRPFANQRTFFIDGVPDGDYEVVAQGNISPDEMAMTSPRKVTVSGADVSGIRLIAMPLASIAGTVSIEAPSLQTEACPGRRESSTLAEAYLRSLRDEKRSESDTIDRLNPRGAAVSERGEFVIRNIRPGPHRLLADLPDERWYLKGLSMPGTSAGRKIDLAKAGLTLKPGEKLSTITITLGTGAGSIEGSLSGEKAKRGRWRVYMVPVALGESENTLVYYEANADRDEGFRLTHLAPGKYWLVARLVPDDEPWSASPTRPLAWDSAERARLRREAEAGKIEIEVKECSRIKGYTLPTN